MKEYKTSIPEKNGISMIVEPENEILDYLHMEFLRLSEGQSCKIGRTDRETGILLMGGKFTVSHKNLKENNS